MFVKKNLDYATGVDTSDLTAKKDFIALKAEVDKRDINKLFDVPTSLKNLERKVDNLDFSKWKTVPIDLKKKKRKRKKRKEKSDVVDTEVVENINFNTVKTKVNDVEKEKSFKSIQQR